MGPTQQKFRSLWTGTRPMSPQLLLVDCQAAFMRNPLDTARVRELKQTILNARHIIYSGN
jgi:hypothetical protein